MDDRLEKFIRSHRAEMDDKHPKRDLWAGIEHELGQQTRQRHISKSIMYWRAAAVILLLITSWLVIDKVYIQGEGNENPELAVVDPELRDVENFYVSLIDQKRKEVKKLSEKYDFGKDFVKEIEALDTMYLTLKQDLNKGNKEDLVDAMILNLQLRIELLNEQLSIIQSIEKSNKDEQINI